MRAHAVRRSSCSASEGPNCRHTSVATLLTLVFLPALYVAWFRIRRPDPVARSGCSGAFRSRATRNDHSSTNAVLK
jgi:hypothetical protein